MSSEKFFHELNEIFPIDFEINNKFMSSDDNVVMSVINDNEDDYYSTIAKNLGIKYQRRNIAADVYEDVEDGDEYIIISAEYDNKVVGEWDLESCAIWIANKDNVFTDYDKYYDEMSLQFHKYVVNYLLSEGVPVPYSSMNYFLNNHLSMSDSIEGLYFTKDTKGNAKAYYNDKLIACVNYHSEIPIIIPDNTYTSFKSGVVSYITNDYSNYLFGLPNADVTISSKNIEGLEYTICEDGNAYAYYNDNIISSIDLVTGEISIIDSGWKHAAHDDIEKTYRAYIDKSEEYVIKEYLKDTSINVSKKNIERDD